MGLNLHRLLRCAKFIGGTIVTACLTVEEEEKQDELDYSPTLAFFPGYLHEPRISGNAAIMPCLRSQSSIQVVLGVGESIINLLESQNPGATKRW